ncbi:MAG: protein kinase [Verrucomicrobia bacterium]|nr:protein kinase [Verrucomicrobiota bacterium]
MNNPIEPKPPSDPAKPPSSAGPTPSTARGPLFPEGPPDIPDHELLRCIGRGAYGEVWLARNVMGTYRAVKVVYRRTFDHDRPYEREFTGIRRFEPVSRKHHSQVDILHVGRDDERGYFYYVMELADDASLESEKGERRESEKVRKWESGKSPPTHSPTHSPAHRAGQAAPAQTPLSPATPLSPLTPRTPTPLSALRTPDSYIPHTLKWEMHQRGRLPFDECLQIALGLTTALEHLHSHGLVHRDIKPSNIIFVDGVAKLADIGLVAVVEASMSFVGTPGYFPPEGTGTPSADLYALGKVLYEVSLGQDRQEFPKLPPGFAALEEHDQLLEFNAVLVKACQTDPAKRYESAADMHADLLLIQSGKSIQRMRWLEQRQSLFTKIGVAAALLIALVLVALHLAREQAKREATLRTRAEAGESQAQQNAYASDMNLAQQALKDSNLGRALELLTRHIPQSGQQDLRGWEWRYLWGRCRSEEICTLGEHERWVMAIDFSSDGRLLASCDWGSVVKVWDVGRRQLVAERKMRPWAWALAFAPRTNLLAVPDGGRVLLCEADKLDAPIASYRQWGTYRIAFSPDGQKTVSATKPNIVIHDWARAESRVLPGIAGLNLTDVLPFAIAPDLNTVAIGLKDGPIVLWDVATDSARDLLQGHETSVWGLDFSPDGATLASGSGDASVRLWHVASRSERTRLSGHRSSAGAVAFSPDGRTLASAGADQTVMLWSVGTGQRLRTLQGHLDGVSAVRFSPIGGILASGCQDGAIKFWDVKSDTAPSRPRALPEPALPDRAAAYRYGLSADGRTLFTLNTNGVLRFWDSLHFKEKKSVAGVHEVFSFGSISPDGRYVCLGFSEGTDGKVSLVDSAQGTVSRFNAHGSNEVDALAFTWDSRGLATAGADWKIKVWDLTGTGNGVRRKASFDVSSPAQSEPYVITSAFSPQGDLLAVGDVYGRIEIWNIPLTRRVADFSAHSVTVARIAFSPDGTQFATAGIDGKLRLWEVRSQRQVGHEMKGQLTGVGCVTFSPDGRRLVAGGGTDGAIKIWDLATFQELLTLEGHRYPVTDVAFLDENTLVSISSEAVFFWEAPDARSINP